LDWKAFIRASEWMPPAVGNTGLGSQLWAGTCGAWGAWGACGACAVASVAQSAQAIGNAENLIGIPLGSGWRAF
jgi:hypothetical protein